jgi:hypothetical protein
LPDPEEFKSEDDEKSPGVNKAPANKESGLPAEGSESEEQSKPETTETDQVSQGNQLVFTWPEGLAGPNDAMQVSTGSQQPIAGASPETTPESDAPAASNSNQNEQEPARFSEKPPKDDSPIRISVDARGNLVLNSDNPAALDRLEQLMSEIAPPRREFDVFHIEHTSPTWIRLNLVTYFKEREDKKDSGNDFMRDYFGFDFDTTKKKETALDTKPPLRFISDSTTQTILVQGADDLDRQTIRQLIEIWDVPDPPPKEENVRRTRLIQVKNSRAEMIVTTVKEVYRDLLSATDSTFQEPKKEEGGEEGGSNPPPRPFNFSGTLALGIDPVTNSIVVTSSGSSSEQLMEMACELIEMLDQAARPGGVVEVVELNSGSRAEHIRLLMNKLLQSAADRHAAGGAEAKSAENAQKQAQEQAQKEAQNAEKQSGKRGNRGISFGPEVQVVPDDQ